MWLALTLWAFAIVAPVVDAECNEFNQCPVVDSTLWKADNDYVPQQCPLRFRDNCDENNVCYDPENNFFVGPIVTANRQTINFSPVRPDENLDEEASVIVVSLNPQRPSDAPKILSNVTSDPENNRYPGLLREQIKVGPGFESTDVQETGEALQKGIRETFPMFNLHANMMGIYKKTNGDYTYERVYGPNSAYRNVITCAQLTYTDANSVAYTFYVWVFIFDKLVLSDSTGTKVSFGQKETSCKDQVLEKMRNFKWPGSISVKELVALGYLDNDDPTNFVLEVMYAIAEQLNEECSGSAAAVAISDKNAKAQASACTIPSANTDSPSNWPKSAGANQALPVWRSLTYNDRFHPSKTPYFEIAPAGLQKTFTVDQRGGKPLIDFGVAISTAKSKDVKRACKRVYSGDKNYESPVDGCGVTQGSGFKDFTQPWPGDKQTGAQLDTNFELGKNFIFKDFQKLPTTVAALDELRDLAYKTFPGLDTSAPVVIFWEFPDGVPSESSSNLFGRAFVYTPKTENGEVKPFGSAVSTDDIFESTEKVFVYFSSICTPEPTSVPTGSPTLVPVPPYFHRLSFKAWISNPVNGDNFEPMAGVDAKTDLIAYSEAKVLRTKAKIITTNTFAGNATTPGPKGNRNITKNVSYYDFQDNEAAFGDALKEAKEDPNDPIQTIGSQLYAAVIQTVHPSKTADSVRSLEFDIFPVPGDWDARESTQAYLDDYTKALDTYVESAVTFYEQHFVNALYSSLDSDEPGSAEVTDVYVYLFNNEEPTNPGKTKASDVARKKADAASCDGKEFAFDYETNGCPCGWNGRDFDGDGLNDCHDPCPFNLNIGRLASGIPDNAHLGAAQTLFGRCGNNGCFAPQKDTAYNENPPLFAGDTDGDNTADCKDPCPKDDNYPPNNDAALLQRITSDDDCSPLRDLSPRTPELCDDTKAKAAIVDADGDGIIFCADKCDDNAEIDDKVANCPCIEYPSDLDDPEKNNKFTGFPECHNLCSVNGTLFRRNEFGCCRTPGVDCNNHFEAVEETNKKDYEERGDNPPFCASASENGVACTTCLDYPLDSVDRICCDLDYQNANDGTPNTCYLEDTDVCPNQNQKINIGVYLNLTRFVKEKAKAVTGAGNIEPTLYGNGCECFDSSTIAAVLAKSPTACSVIDPDNQDSNCDDLFLDKDNNGLPDCFQDPPCRDVCKPVKYANELLSPPPELLKNGCGLCRKDPKAGCDATDPTKTSSSEDCSEYSEASYEFACCLRPGVCENTKATFQDSCNLKAECTETITEFDRDGDGLHCLFDVHPSCKNIATDHDNDCFESCPNDADVNGDHFYQPFLTNRTDPRVCPCWKRAQALKDTDGDKVLDCIDQCCETRFSETSGRPLPCPFPVLAPYTFNDSVANNTADNDNDGFPNCIDACPNGPNVNRSNATSPCDRVLAAAEGPDDPGDADTISDTTSFGFGAASGTAALLSLGATT